MINLTHTVEEINLIIAALRELPHKLVEELINKIKVQATPQVNPQGSQVTPPVEKAEGELVEQFYGGKRKEASTPPNRGQG